MRRQLVINPLIGRTKGAPKEEEAVNISEELGLSSQVGNVATLETGKKHS